jgi:rhomboid protease GluP
MATVSDETLLQLLQACADAAPLYPARYAKAKNLDRARLDEGLDELRRRGLIKLTDWVKDFGQGRALTEAGSMALATRRLTIAPSADPSQPAEARVLAYERGEMARDAVYYAITPYVCRTLIAVNVLFFLYGAFVAWRLELPVTDYLVGKDGGQRTTTIVLFETGALWGPAIFSRGPHARPEFERIVLFFFLHIGVLHLAMNMFFLATLGPLIEGMWGRVRFLAIYFIAGIVSGCVVLSLNMLERRDSLTAGASGALSGLFASMLAWFYLNRQHIPPQLLQDWSRTLAINAFILIGISMVPGVSWQGHLGGAIGGFLAAPLIYAQRFHPSRTALILALLGLPLIPAAFFGVALWQAGWF